MAPAIIFIVAVPLLLLLFILSYKHLLSGKKPNLPPSPPGLPIIGNLLQLSSLPHRSLHALSQAHGPLMLVRMGQVPTLVVSSAAVAREVLKTHDLAFSNRPFSKINEKLAYGGRNVSFSRYGEYWRQTRKLAVVHLLSSKCVQSFHSVRKHVASRMIEKISDGHEVVNLSEVVYDYSNGVVSRAVAGELGNAAKFREMMEEVSVLFGGFQVYDMFPAIGWLSTVTGLDAKLEKLARSRDVFLSGIVEEHVKRRHRDAAAGEEEDFVDLLLSLTEEERQEESELDFVLTKDDIKALVMDMIAAGTDTSYVVLEWTMAELMKNPGKMKKAQDEVREISNGKTTVTEDDIPQMSYLKAVIKEVLRLHPPPLLIPHESHQRIVLLQGYEIPERFLGSCSVDFNGLDFRFIPFGAGRRMCPGINFAITSIEFALASLLYHFNWRLPQVFV